MAVILSRPQCVDAASILEGFHWVIHGIFLTFVYEKILMQLYSLCKKLHDTVDSIT